MFVRLSVDKSYQFDPEITDFIDNYRKLPLAARAKLENWHINPKIIQAKSVIKDDNGVKSFRATYHGLDVHARLYDSGCKTADGSGLHAEMCAMVQLRHPNIVGFLGASISPDSCLVVMELMALGSLRSFYRAKQTEQPRWLPSKSQARSWSLDLVRAVNYLHQSDPAVTHRDLRPETVFLAASGVLKVSGFGRCRMRPWRRASRTARLSLQGVDLLLPTEPDSDRRSPCLSRDSGYVAPELWRDPEQSGDGVDVFAAAMLICFMHTGRDPQPPAGSGSESRPWAAPAGLGRGSLAAALTRAGSDDATARPTANELIDLLEGVRRGPACRVS